MVKRLGNKRGLKRMAPDNLDTFTSRNATKNRQISKKVSPSPSPAGSGESSQEHSSDEAPEEQVVYNKEPSTYDNLLMKLGSNSESLAAVYRRRQREEEGKSDTEEEVDENESSESSGASDEEDDIEEGSENEYENVRSRGSKLVDPIRVDIAEQKEHETEDSDEDSDMDQDHNTVNDQCAVDVSEGMSSFTVHMDHKILKAEMDNLTSKKWKYEWEVPANDKPNCKWTGTGKCFLKDVHSNSAHGLTEKLYRHCLEVYKSSTGKDFHSSKQRRLFSLCDSYRDILHCNKKPFYLKGPEEDSSFMDAYIMHALNHVFRTRDLVKKNDGKVSKHQDTAKEEILLGDGFLDHGFTRPKVLILLPLASVAFRVVKRLIQLTPSSSKINVEHIDRFSADFETESVEDCDDKSSKTSEFRALFGGKKYDHFMMGIKFTRSSIKLYSDFYSSDMIVASPLGLMTKIGEAELEKEKDVDYLSSIEVLIIDHADIIAMQNWSHVNTVVGQLNRLPSKQHGTDVMRIRQWYLNGHAQFYRQTIILGSYSNPDINYLFNHHCVNYQGKVKLVSEYKGVLPKVLLQVRQIYERFDAASMVEADDARLEYFTNKVFPKIKDSIQGGIMLFISSYFEFVRLRKFLLSQKASFCLLGEYTKPEDISRARGWFFKGERKMILYTERAHFYKRYKIRGIKNLIIYSLPERKEFYPEIINMLEGSDDMSCTVLFSRFDWLRLERIVGTTHAKRMVKSDKDIFVFC